MAQPPEPADDDVSKDLLSSLPGEIELEIAKHLSYADLCNVRGTSRALSGCFVDPATRLADEISKAWVEIGSHFRDEYWVSLNLSLPGLIVNGKTLGQRVEEHAVQCGFSKTLARWLAHPKDFHYPCSKCRVVKPWDDFPFDSLRRTYPIGTPMNPPATQQEDTIVLGTSATSVGSFDVDDAGP
ncbi:hypothetical protein AYL99_09146 [Fonsecaea erecta]|uniref:F-box domain-containing protein n=1 Tax=Fonsecaea erecta TaxID=1367422 RepID=A0A178ZCY0_9EURO|nr:hypothetical protein AYL99_09146 [Fonsecaea erecta]OAP57033.1 hypothetical protein AYL99_09146 [Fonsecaea erecta]